MSLLVQNKSKKFRYILFFTQVISFIFFFGCRDFVIGTDTDNYLDIFLRGALTRDGGYNYIMATARTYFGDFRSVMLIVSFVINVNLGISYLILMKNQKRLNIIYVLLCTMPFMILFNINVIRQGLGLSFILLGVALWVKNHKVFSVVPFTISVFFHSSMIGVSPLVFFVLLLNVDHRFILVAIALALLMSNLGVDDMLIGYTSESLQVKFLSYKERNGLIGFLPLFSYYMIHFSILMLSYIKSRDYILRKLIAAVGVMLIVGGFFMDVQLFGTRFLIGIDLIIPAAYCFLLANLDTLEIKWLKYTENLGYFVLVIIVFNLPPIITNFNW